MAARAAAQGAARTAARQHPATRCRAWGSGFVIDPSGLIVTNNHVIKGADTITVTLQDDTVLKARLLGHDDKTDLALLKVDPAHPLPAVAFGKQRPRPRRRLGGGDRQPVRPVRQPSRRASSPRAAARSTAARTTTSSRPTRRSTAATPAARCSNMDGDVIGINTAIYSPSGGSIGIGFSIPSNEAAGVIAQLRQYGRARRGWIGVRIQDVSQDIADSLGLKTARGALVAGIEPNGPAAKAGLRTGGRDPDRRRAGGGRPQPAARGRRDRGRAERAAGRLARRQAPRPCRWWCATSPRTLRGRRRAPASKKPEPVRRRSTSPGWA